MNRSRAKMLIGQYEKFFGNDVKISNAKLVKIQKAKAFPGEHRAGVRDSGGPRAAPDAALLHQRHPAEHRLQAAKG